MGNMVGVVAAISVGGSGAVFWMWVTALMGASTAFVEATLAQLYKKNDPLFGGYRGGPAYYLHAFFGRGKKKSILAAGFALSGLLCWCGVSQVIGNSVSASFQNAFSVPPMVSTVVLVALVMLFIGGLAAYTFVWDLGDIGIGLMTIFNLIAVIPMSGKALAALRDYEARKEELR